MFPCSSRLLLRRCSSSSSIRFYSSLDYHNPQVLRGIYLFYPFPPHGYINPITTSQTLLPHDYSNLPIHDCQDTPTETSLVGPRLTLHKHVKSLISYGYFDSACSCVINNNEHPQQPLLTHARPSVLTCNNLLLAMNAAKRYKDATALFSYFFVDGNDERLQLPGINVEGKKNKKKFTTLTPNLESYNNLLQSYCHSNNVDEALKVYHHIVNNTPYTPIVPTYHHLTEALANSGRMDEAVDLLDGMLDVVNFGEERIYDIIVKGFLKLGDVDSAMALRDEAQQCMNYKGMVHWTMLEWFFEAGEERVALTMIQEVCSLGYVVSGRARKMIKTLRDAGLENTKEMELLEDFIDEEREKYFREREEEEEEEEREKYYREREEEEKKKKEEEAKLNELRKERCDFNKM